MLTVVLVLTELNAYKIFNLSETMNSERITEIIQETIFVVSPQCNIIYINPFGVLVTGTSGNEKKKLKDIFPNSNSSYKAFESQVVIPAFKKEACKLSILNERWGWKRKTLGYLYLPNF